MHKHKNSNVSKFTEEKRMTKIHGRMGKFKRVKV